MDEWLYMQHKEIEQKDFLSMYMHKLFLLTDKVHDSRTCMLF